MVCHDRAGQRMCAVKNSTMNESALIFPPGNQLSG